MGGLFMLARLAVDGLDLTLHRGELFGLLGTNGAGRTSTLEALTMWSRTLSTPRPVLDVPADVDLTDRASTRISSLSGGEVRRLDLATAIAGDPELLFLDEPTTGLDPEPRARAWELIASLKRRGTTIVLTTHTEQRGSTSTCRSSVQ
jgi:ABC-2 type transport system ATP-binding protein